MFKRFEIDDLEITVNEDENSVKIRDKKLEVETRTTMKELSHSAELHTYGVSDGMPYSIQDKYLFLNGQYGHIMLDFDDKSVKGLDFYHDRELEIFPKNTFNNIINNLVDIKPYKNKFIESEKELEELKEELKTLKERS